MKKFPTKLNRPLAILLAGVFLTPVSFAKDNPYLMRVVLPGAKAEVVVPKEAIWSQTSGISLIAPDAAVGVTKTASITVKNSGNVPGSYTIPALGGTNPGDFSVASNCNGIPPNNTCNLTVSFTPTAEGTRTATLKLGADTITLTGNGTSSTGTDPYYANVVLQMHFDGAAGSNALISQKGPTPSGTATIAGGAYALAGTGSLKLTASTTLTFAPDVNLYLPGDYTIEYWFMPTAAPTGNAILMTKVGASYPSYGATVAGSGSTVQFYVWFGNGVNATTGGLMYAYANLPLNQWAHIVQETINGEHRYYVNGALISSGGSQVDSTSALSITLASGVTGYLDELRVTKGVGRYSGAFTPSRTATPDK